MSEHSVKYCLNSNPPFKRSLLLARSEDMLVTYNIPGCLACCWKTSWDSNFARNVSYLSSVLYLFKNPICSTTNNNSVHVTVNARRHKTLPGLAGRGNRGDTTTPFPKAAPFHLVNGNGSFSGPAAVEARRLSTDTPPPFRPSRSDCRLGELHTVLV